jgi:hypothetical protein
MMSTTAVNAETAQYWDCEATERAKAAAKLLYVLGVLAARQGTRITYPEAAECLYLAGHGFSYHRSIGQVMEALAALCAKLEAPDLSSLFWRKDGSVVRWESVEDKVEAERQCRSYLLWPSLAAV